MKSITALMLALTLSFTAYAADVSGLWVGYYSYDARSAGKPVECSMVVEQEGQEIYAWMIERQTFGPEPSVGLLALIFGNVVDNDIALIKVYDHDQEGPGVPYALTVSKDGNTLSGTWQAGAMTGTAVFKRVTTRGVDRMKP